MHELHQKTCRCGTRFETAGRTRLCPDCRPVTTGVRPHPAGAASFTPVPTTGLRIEQLAAAYAANSDPNYSPVETLAWPGEDEPRRPVRPSRESGKWSAELVRVADRELGEARTRRATGRVPKPAPPPPPADPEGAILAAVGDRLLVPTPRLLASAGVHPAVGIPLLHRLVARKVLDRRRVGSGQYAYQRRAA